jgi:homoserine kinase
MHDKTTGHSGAEVQIFGPASLSNLGPGFDALGLCIAGVGDVIGARRVEAPGVHLEHDPGIISWVLPKDHRKNTAVIAAEGVLALVGENVGVAFTLKKGIPLGSGIGGSAASAVAGAWAVNVLFGSPLEKEALIEAVLDAEDVASGGRHGDNALPALLGGLVLVSSSDPSRYRRIELPGALHLALILPDVEVLTRQAREMLPDAVPLRDAVHNASELAFLVDAYRCGDWETVGRCMMQDRLVEPIRAGLVPCYDAVRAAALDAGAYGCALTGSGPAMFAVAGSENEAAQIRDAMIEASLAGGVDARGIVTEANDYGVAEMAELRAEPVDIS